MPCNILDNKAECNIWIKSGFVGTGKDGVAYLGHAWLEWTSDSGKFKSAGFYQKNDEAHGPGSVMSDDPHSVYKDARWSAKFAIRSTGELQHGKYKGRKCCNVTCFHVRDCLDAKIQASSKYTYNIMFYNCHSWAWEAADECCLCVKRYFEGNKKVGGTGDPYDHPPHGGPTVPPPPGYNRTK